MNMISTQTKSLGKQEMASQEMTAQPAVLFKSVIRNGINVTAFKETIDAIDVDDDIGKFQFRATNEWLGSDLNRTTIGGFYGACSENVHAKGPFQIDNAQPPVLLGKGQAPSPIEYLLSALAGCLTNSLIYHAAASKIEVEEVSSALEGDLDLRGFLGITGNVCKGFDSIRVKMRVRSDAKPEHLVELAKFSPVYDIVSGSIAVEIDMETY